MLDPCALNAFQTDGHISMDDGLSTALFERLHRHVDAFVAAQADPSIDYFPDLIAQDYAWIEYATAPAVLDAVAQILGEDIILWGSGLFCKSAVGGKATPWHQDAEYWPIRPLRTCTVWIAIDHSTTANGCLRVISGSHKARKMYAHQANSSKNYVLNQEIAPDAMPDASPVDIELKPGAISIHDAFLVHGAEPNNSGQRRAGVAFRYMPASSHFDRELAHRQTTELGVVDISKRHLHLVRGVNRESRNDLSSLPAFA